MKKASERIGELVEEVSRYRLAEYKKESSFEFMQKISGVTEEDSLNFFRTNPATQFAALLMYLDEIQK